MKKWIYIAFVFALIIGCVSSKKTNGKTLANEKAIKNDTIRIANEELEYEVIIIDPGFSTWLATHGKPRNFYTQSYLEARNRDWVIGWNNKFMQGNRLFEMSINYDNSIDYGYEVNYMLYNYLTYFQLSNNIRLGGFAPRI